MVFQKKTVSVEEAMKEPGVVKQLDTQESLMRDYWLHLTKRILADIEHGNMKGAILNAQELERLLDK